MKRLVMQPDGWPCAYMECRPGYFVSGDSLCLKSEYGQDGFGDSGEFFARHELVVQPVIAVWEEYE